MPYSHLRAAFAVLILAAFGAAAPTEKALRKVDFPSKDKLKITADLYAPHKDKKTPFLVLFHQAGWSRGEYREIAPKLNKLGYNCLAIDQRSGGTINGVANETMARAKKAGKGMTYLDARQDLVAALEYARKNHAKGKLVAWGSSYSSALVLHVVGEKKKLADGVMSFAPGEYFARFGKSKTWIRDAAKKLKHPTFITSAKREHRSWKAIYDAIPKGKKAFYLPETKGNHGSRALWEQFPDHEGYWKAVRAFLAEHFPTKKAKKDPKKKK